jgi:hypothetical protein
MWGAHAFQSCIDPGGIAAGVFGQEILESGQIQGGKVDLQEEECHESLAEI